MAAYGEFQSLVALLGMLGVVSATLSYFVIAHTSVFAHHQNLAANRQFITWLNRRSGPALLVVVALFIVLSVPLQHALHLSDPWGAVAIGIAAALSISTVIYTGLFSGWQNFLAVYTLGGLGALLKLVAAVIILALWPTASAAAVVMLTAVAGVWLLAHWWGKRVFHLTDIDKKNEAPTWRQAYFARRHAGRDLGFIIAFTLATLFIQNADILLVRHLTSAELAGHYGALNLLGKIILWVNLGIVSVVLPIAVADEHGGLPLRHRVRLLAYGLVLLGSIGVIALYWLLPRLVINVTVGHQYLSAAPSLRLLGLMNLSLSLLLLEANFAFARREPLLLGILGSAAVVFSVGIIRSPHVIAAIAHSGLVAFSLGAAAVFLLNYRSSTPRK